MKKDTKKWIPASEKLSAINDYLTGRGSFKEIAKLYNVSHVTVMNWVNAKDDIINECRACAIMFPYETQENSLGEDAVNGNRYSLREQNRRLLKDEKRLRYRVSYLESLLEINGIKENNIAKKK